MHCTVRPGRALRKLQSRKLSSFNLENNKRKAEQNKLIVLGANSGIGKVTALELAKRGARLILLCRNVDKATKAAQEIKTAHKEAQIVIHQLDLASMKSIRNCAQTLIDTEDKMDILVNNAGTMKFNFDQ